MPATKHVDWQILLIQKSFTEKWDDKPFQRHYEIKGFVKTKPAITAIARLLDEASKPYDRNGKNKNQESEINQPAIIAARE